MKLQEQWDAESEDSKWKQDKYQPKLSTSDYDFQQVSFLEYLLKQYEKPDFWGSERASITRKDAEMCVDTSTICKYIFAVLNEHAELMELEERYSLQDGIVSPAMKCGFELEEQGIAETLGSAREAAKEKLIVCKEAAHENMLYGSAFWRGKVLQDSVDRYWLKSIIN